MCLVQRAMVRGERARERAGEAAASQAVPGSGTSMLLAMSGSGS